MKESEAWDMLGQIIESKLETTKDNQYICFYLNGSLNYGTEIPTETRLVMKQRCVSHKETDIRLYGWDNLSVQPPSWYQDIEYFNLCNQWRVLFCYAMAWEAWEEEMTADA